jgi:hypothetical protein
MIVASLAGVGIGALWFLSWVASIVLAFWLLSRSPKVPGMSQLAQASRIAMVISAFVPCLFIDILAVLTWYGIYRVSIRGMGDQSGLQVRFENAGFNAQAPQQTRPPEPSGNPFTQDQPPGGQPYPQAPAPGNPFTDNPPAASQQPPAPPLPPRQTPPSGNPFLQE